MTPNGEPAFTTLCTTQVILLYGVHHHGHQGYFSVNKWLKKKKQGCVVSFPIHVSIFWQPRDVVQAFCAFTAIVINLHFLTMISTGAPPKHKRCPSVLRNKDCITIRIPESRYCNSLPDHQRGKIVCRKWAHRTKLYSTISWNCSNKPMPVKHPPEDSHFTTTESKTKSL